MGEGLDFGRFSKLVDWFLLIIRYEYRINLSVSQSISLSKLFGSFVFKKEFTD